MGKGILCASSLALLCAAGAADASPLELYSFGGRSSAMAGSGVATARGFECVYLNPAGLAGVTDSHLSAGLSYGHFDLRVDGDRLDKEGTSATTFGTVVPIRLGGSLEDRVTMALGILVPHRAIARARSAPVGEPYFALLDARSEIVGIQVGGGFQLDDTWNIGAGILALATLQGLIHVEVDGAGRFLTQSEQQLKTDFAPILGVRHAAPESAWQFGATFRFPSTAGQDMLITNALGEELPLSLPELQVLGTPQYDPATLSIEAAYQWSPSILLSAQLDAQRWSAFELPAENPLANGMPLPGANFSDTLIPHLALEWQERYGATQVHGRAGYAFRMTPAPEMDGVHTLLDNHRHVLAGGVGVAWPESDYPFTLDLWVQAHQLQSRSHTKDPALFADPDDIPFDSVDSSGRIMAGGAVLGVEL